MGCKRFSGSIAVMLLALAVLWNASPLAASAAERYEAADGVLDLTDFRFDRSTADLKGEWHFYWKQLLDPDDFASASSAAAGRLVRVPDTWQSYAVDGERLPREGYATYRLIVRFSETEVGRRFALRIGNVATAYRLWIDGVEAGGNGVVGTDRGSMVAANYSRTYSFELESTETAITIQAANFVQRKGGLWDAIRLGYEERLLHDDVREMVVESGLAGIFAMIGFYHLLLFLLRRENREALYFGLVCLAIGLRVTVTGQAMLYRILPGFNWELGVKMEYWGFLIAALFFLLYYSTLFPREMNVRLIRAGTFVLIVCNLSVAVLPAAVYTRYLPAYSLIIMAVILYTGWTVFLALIRSRPDAWLHAAAWLFVLMTAMNDLLFYNLFISTGDLLPIGILTAVLIQAVILSLRNVRAYRDIHRLSHELSQFNESLELKIRERTAELERANEELREAWYTIANIEQSRRRLMSNVSHELGTPLAVAQGYVKGMMDGVVPAGDPKYLRLVYEKMQVLGRIVDDLGELSKLEARMAAFDWKPLHIGEFVKRTAASMQGVFEQSGIRLICDEHALDGSAGVRVKADAIRLEQVMTNLLFNARKHTPPGGTVQLSCTIADFDGRRMAVICVADNGKGIPPDALPFVFDRHFQSRPESGAAEGMGLGLAICKEIVEIHGGVIDVESMAGEGSRFYIRLPVLEDDQDKGADQPSWRTKC